MSESEKVNTGWETEADKNVVRFPFKPFKKVAHAGARILTIDELDSTPPPDDLIEGIIPGDAIGMLFGDSGSYKSFLAQDFARCVATGTPWFDRPVTQGDVVYCVAEGSGFFKLRMAACRLQHGLSEDDLRRFATIPEPWIMNSTADDFKCTVAKIKAMGASPRLIVIDTLGRCIDGNENTFEGMKVFYEAADFLRRGFPGCTVLVVHHVGHGSQDRAMGSKLFNRNTDFEMMLKKSKSADSLSATFTCTKSRNDGKFQPIAIKLKLRDLSDIFGFRRDGRPWSSLAVEEVDFGDGGWGEGGETRADAAANNLKALEALTGLGGRARYNDWLTASGLPKSTFKRVVYRLKEPPAKVGHDGVEYYELAEVVVGSISKVDPEMDPVDSAKTISDQGPLSPQLFGVGEVAPTGPDTAAATDGWPDFYGDRRAAR